MVPNGWLKERLGNVASFKNGLNFTRDDRGEIVKIVGVGDFKDLSELRNTSQLDHVQISCKLRDDELLKSGDLLFVRSNGNKNLIGRCLFFPKIEEKIAYSGFTIRGRVNTNKILPQYASFLVRSSFVKRQFAEGGNGTNISNLSQQVLSEVSFYLPPLREQEKIARIISTWEESIQNTEALVQNSLETKKSLMSTLLTGKKRLPGFNEDWTELKFGQVFKERIESGNSHLPLLSITSEGGIISRADVGRKDTSNDDKSKYLKICPGDIGYNTMRMWQGVAGLSRVEGIVSPAYTVLIPQADVDPLYTAYLFKLPALIHIFYRHSQGMVSDTWSLKYSNFSKIKWAMPAIEEQRAISSLLAIADNELAILKDQLAYLKNEKSALMQQLLTGRRRVNVEII
ncbi:MULTISPECIES: restriction endonuclease subunit S [Pseudomonas]|uniref:restriction endonuclease subunit S n=1 Tax=Pseudomonas TaxID=286 RepID=UPI001FF3A935|nr:restriction endonuclease subunit S [Pseudomonas sp. YL2]